MSKRDMLIMRHFSIHLSVAFLLTVSGVMGRALSDIDNPRKSPGNCGRSQRSNVCDPDGILTSDEGVVLDEAISDLSEHTSCPCTPQQCTDDGSGYKIGVALVRSMDIDSEVHSLDASGESKLAQQLNARLATARSYASSLLNRWQLGRCGEVVLVFCSQDDAICYTAADTTARKKLTDDIIGEIAANSRGDVSYNLTVRLVKMIRNYKLVFLDTYNRTTNWKYSRNEPEVARVIVSSQTSLHIPAQCLTAFFATFLMLLVCVPRPFRLYHF